MPHSPTPGPHIVVIGGGDAGLSIAGRLTRARIGHVTVVEPRTRHVYAPLQSHIAGGTARASQAVRPQATSHHPGCDGSAMRRSRWIR